jgi:large subunit ribosomal protein L9
MEILLKRTIETLGRIGDVVSVKPGYARNFLLPRGYAVPVTEANLAVIEKERAKALAQERLRVADLKEIAEKIAQTSVTIEGRANEEGHLFGSVNAAQIAAALRTKGFPIDDRHVRLPAALKEIGVFDVPLHLDQKVDCTVKVWVVQQKPG